MSEEEEENKERRMFIICLGENCQDFEAKKEEKCTII